MKKIILGLAAGAILILTACGNSNNSDTSTVEKGKTKGNNIEAEISTSEEIVEHGFWNDDKTEFTTAYGEKLSKEETTSIPFSYFIELIFIFLVI